MSPKFAIITGSLLLSLAVGFGAFGAHIVQDTLSPERFDVYQTAVQYHFYHSLGLILLGLIMLHIKDSKWLKWSGYLLTAGIIIFSGSLYILTLTDTGWLGAITPLGGFAFVLGWFFLAAGAWKDY